MGIDHQIKTRLRAQAAKARNGPQPEPADAPQLLKEFFLVGRPVVRKSDKKKAFKIWLSCIKGDVVDK